MNFDNGFVDQVKNSVDIVKVISEYVRLRKAGANYLGLCPFHSEKTPSFNVHAGRQFYKCFGCDAKGDIFKFIQSIERITFPESVKFLADRYGIPMPRFDASEDLDEAAKERLALLEINSKAVAVFRDQLSRTREGNQANNYLKERGVSAQTLERFDLGYSLSSGDGVLRKLGGQYPAGLLLKSGLILSGDPDSHLYDRFRKRVMFPIRSEGGKYIAFGGRILGEGQPKYLNSPETPVYSKSRVLYALFQAREVIRRKNSAILVEGYMDCIALHQAGIENVVASCGTSLTDSQAKLLARFTDRVVVNFDPDSAGAAAALRSLNTFLENGFSVRVLSLPGGDDPDAFVRRRGGEEYLHLLEKAPSYFEYLLERAHRGHDTKTVEGKVKAVDSLLPYLVRVSNRIERTELVKRVAEEFRIDESLIREELKSAASQHREPAGIKRPSQRSELMQSEKYLLKAILEDESTAQRVLPELAASRDYLGLPSENLFKEIVTLYTEQGRVDLMSLQDRLYSEQDKLFLNQALFTQLNQVEASRCLEAIKRQKTEQEIALLQKQIQQAESSQDFDLLAALHVKKTQLKRLMAR
jgi:DNA primase